MGDAAAVRRVGFIDDIVGGNAGAGVVCSFVVVFVGALLVGLPALLLFVVSWSRNWQVHSKRGWW